MRSRGMYAIIATTVLLLAASACRDPAPTSPAVPARWSTVADVPPAYIQVGDCPAVDRCVGVQGTAESVSAVRWDGVRWDPIPLPAGWLPVAVSCPDTTTCLLAGTVTTAAVDAVRRPLLARWDGTAVTEVPLAETGTDNVIQALACTTGTSCLLRLAKPSGSPTAGGTPGHMLRWDGASFSPTVAPAGVAFTSGLGLLSCGGPASCMAGATSAGVPGVARWDGQGWTFSLLVANAGGRAELRQVSCAAPTFCAALGDASQGTGSARRVTTLVATWAGAAWSAFAPLARPAGEPDPPVDVVQLFSCSSPTWCVAVGGEYTQQTDGTIEPVTLVWTGNGWHRGPPRPRERAMTGFVDCAPGSRWCLASGTFGAADVLEATD
jgi:hypothetical protein